jgi:predicted dienelactone hydrolase
LALYCLALSANAAGIQLLSSDPELAGTIWYPCAGEPKDFPLGNLAVKADFGLKAVKDCPVTGSRLPLIVFSHGRGGWFGQNHDTVEALADAGFVVAAINHPGDNGNDSSGRDTLSVLASRPRDIVRLLDFMLHDWKDKAAIDPARIGFFGFSNGAYTGLVLMGVTPDFEGVASLCKETTGACAQLHNGETPPGPLHDARIRAAIIIDPPAAAFTRDNLAAIKIPLQFWRSEWEVQAWVMVWAMRALQIVCRLGLTFMSCRPATLRSWRRAQRNSRLRYRESAPTIRRISTGRPFTAT